MYVTTKNIDEMIQSADRLRELGFNDTAILNLTKIRSDNHIGLRFLPVKYRPLLDNEEIELSEQCCTVLKKGPLKKNRKRNGRTFSSNGGNGGGQQGPYGSVQTNGV